MAPPPSARHPPNGAFPELVKALPPREVMFGMEVMMETTLAVDLDAPTGSGTVALAPAGEPDVDTPARYCPRCPSIYPPCTDLCPDDRVPLGFCDVPRLISGKYRIEQTIGRGGMGVVYLARDLSLGRLVALKTLFRANLDATERLHREGCAAARLLHPNLAVLFAVETCRGTPVLVFEYLDGGTLAARIRGKPIPIANVIGWGIALAGALEEAHARGVLHCDVKPSNIGFTAAGVPKLLDFGLASLYDSEEPSECGLLNAASTQRRVEGTARYLSPEAIAGEPSRPARDLWGLGITLYEAVTRVNPFVEPELEGTIERILRVPLPDPRGLRPECPEGLGDFFLGALSKNRSERPRSATEFRERLERLAGNARPISA